MTIEELRMRIDVLDRQLVELISERARVAQMIGHLKAASSLPVYEPDREKIIYASVRAANKGPLPDIEMTHIYERILDVMRALQRHELASEKNALAAQSEGRPQGHAADAPKPQRHQLSEPPVAGDPGQAPETGNRK
jgi:chorismate mutase-like protein